MDESGLLMHLASSASFFFSVIGSIGALMAFIGIGPDWIAQFAYDYVASIAYIISHYSGFDSIIVTRYLLCLLGCALGFAAMHTVSEPQKSNIIIAVIVMMLEYTSWFADHSKLPSHPLCNAGETTCDTINTIHVLVLAACAFGLMGIEAKPEQKPEEKAAADEVQPADEKKDEVKVLEKEDEVKVVEKKEQDKKEESKGAKKRKNKKD